jgi:hypothetical protein
MIRLSDKQFQEINDDVSDEAKRSIAEKHPGGDGGWIHLRVQEEQQLEDAMTIVRRKVMSIP